MQEVNLLWISYMYLMMHALSQKNLESTNMFPNDLILNRKRN